jgi:hypothetical protein
VYLWQWSWYFHMTLKQWVYISQPPLKTGRTNTTYPLCFFASLLSLKYRKPGKQMLPRKSARCIFGAAAVWGGGGWNAHFMNESQSIYNNKQTEADRRSWNPDSAFSSTHKVYNFARLFVEKPLKTGGGGRGRIGMGGAE